MKIHDYVVQLNILNLTGSYIHVHITLHFVPTGEISNVTLISFVGRIPASIDRNTISTMLAANEYTVFDWLISFP